MRTKIFLTYNDNPGGIYSSQVLDVCRFLRELTGERIVLVAFVSIRNFITNKRLIKNKDKDAVVLPMFPGVQNWRRNKWLLRSVLKKIKPDLVIARGPFATILASESGAANVCFDARGAYFSEFTEFDVSNGVITPEEIKSVERQALGKCKSAIAVSHALVEYWKVNYAYNGSKHVVIPCTLKSDHRFPELSSVSTSLKIVFAGGNGPWQNLTEMSDLLLPLFESNPDVELILMVKNLPANFELKHKFPNRVKHMWVDEYAVSDILSSCDYGWLMRNKSITNKVASPVKFAEYLAAGLKVIISDSLGDFSGFVRENRCGIVAAASSDLMHLEKITLEEKNRISKLAASYFMKAAYSEQYKTILCA